MTGPDDSPFGRGCEAFDFRAEVLVDHIDLLDFAGFQRAINTYPGLQVGPEPQAR